jgi:group I intron endonuclease
MRMDLEMASLIISQDPELVAWHRGFRAVNGNLPTADPGIYSLVNMVSGKIYIGLSLKIAQRAANHRHRKSGRIGAAIKKYGSATFVVQPLFICLPGNEGFLPDAEALLIHEFDAVMAGYNVQERAVCLGASGLAFRERMKFVFADPRIRAERSKRRKEFLADPANLAKHLAAVSTPEAKRNHIAALKAYRESHPEEFAARQENLVRHSRKPESRERSRLQAIEINNNEAWTRARKIAVAERNKRPEIREINRNRDRSLEERQKISAAAIIRYKDRSARILTGDAVRVALANPVIRQKISKARSYTISITNGIISRWIPKDHPIPEGWKQGRIQRNSKRS